MVKLIASWTHLEKTGVLSKVNSRMQRTRKSLLTFAFCLSPEGLMHFATHTPSKPRTFEQFWSQGSDLIYYFFSNNQHHDWHVNSAALLCRDASYFLPFHLTLDTTLTKHWNRWWAHPKWVAINSLDEHTYTFPECLINKLLKRRQT